MLNSFCHPQGVLKQIDPTQFKVNSYGNISIQKNALDLPFPLTASLSNKHIEYKVSKSDSDHKLLSNLNKSLATILDLSKEELSAISTGVASYLKGFMALKSLHKVHVAVDFVYPLKQVDVGQGFHYDKFANRMIIALIGPNLDWTHSDKLHAKTHHNMKRGKAVRIPLSDIKTIPENSVVFFRGDKLAHRRPVNSPARLLIIATEVTSDSY